MNGELKSSHSGQRIFVLTLPFVALVLFCFYLIQLAPSVHVHDAGELTASAWTLGIGHPPGSPLYMLVSKLFMTIVPYGHIAWRANLFSTVMACIGFVLLAVWFFQLSRHVVLSLFGSLALFVTPVVWSQAEMAEVYTFEVVIILVFLISYTRFAQGLISGLFPAFVWGLLLTCHMGLLPMTPVIYVMLIWHGRKEQEERIPLNTIVKTGAALMLPFILFFYLPLRSLGSPPMDWGDPQTLERFYWHISNRMIRGRMLTLPLDQYWARLLDYGGIIGKNVHILLPLSAMGIVAPVIRHRVKSAHFTGQYRLTLLLVVMFMIDAFFVIMMDIAPLASEAYAIPSITALIILAFSGTLSIGNTFTRGVGVALFLCSIGFSIVNNHAENDLHRNFIIRDTVENRLMNVPRSAVLFTQEDNTTFPLAYLIFVEGARPDLRIYDRQGNLFDTAYDRPLFLIDREDLSRYRQKTEGELVATLLAQRQEVCFTTQFLDYEAGSWGIRPRATVGEAYLFRNSEETQQGSGPMFREDLPLRIGSSLDWMSRQVHADVEIARAYSRFRSGDDVRAVNILTEAMGLADVAELFLRMAQLFISLGRHDQALMCLDEAIARNDHFAPAFSLKGFLLMEKGEFAEAETAIKRAIEEGPGLPQPYRSLGMLAIRRGEWSRAHDLLTQSLEIAPGQRDCLYNRALVSLRLNRPAEAAGDLSASLTLDPSFIQGRLALIELFLGRNEFALASRHVCSVADVHELQDLTTDQMKRVLLYSSTVGFTPCLDTWLDSGASLTPEKQALLSAYREAHKAIQHR